MGAASIVVPTYDRPSALGTTLEAIRAMDFPGEQLEIIVVDSGSVSVRSQIPHGIRYVRQSDVGVAAARNYGATLASGDLLMFIDDDIVVRRDNLRQHESIHRQDPRSLVSGHWEFDPGVRAQLERTALGRYRLEYEDRYNKPHGVPSMSHEARVHPLTLAAGNLSVRREVFWSLGGFDERFPVAAEDQDLTWRARRAGCTLVYAYDIPVVHNDQHADLLALCRRQERAAAGMVYFARKNPDAPELPLLELNGPLRPGDSLRLMARKLFRTALSARAPLAMAQMLVSGVEALRPNGAWPLEFLYDAIGGLYVFRGVRRGFRLTSGAAWGSGHQPL